MVLGWQCYRHRVGSLRAGCAPTAAAAAAVAAAAACASLPSLPPLLRAASEALLALPGAGVYSAGLQPAAAGSGGEEGEEGAERAVDPGGACGAVVVAVPPYHSPPPRLAGRSCVYLLQVANEAAAADADVGAEVAMEAAGLGEVEAEVQVQVQEASGSAPDLYVGESAAIGPAPTY